MKNILSVVLLLILSGCGTDLVEESKVAQNKSSISIIDIEFERLDFGDIERVPDSRLRQCVDLSVIPLNSTYNHFCKKITICHKGRITKKVEYRDWLDHRKHGDTRGPCS